ncbi:hypothetical protein [Amycolatopsis cihanbeyliensis]|uniref:hypothetical protein n=1 Tax=Amycolatopsis cihanbeyliensis TaxID=1128664 RepID=UPI00114F8D0F|nr:hypothetical protein [Amycolatopsis cihanbeyliensis]
MTTSNAADTFGVNVGSTTTIRLGDGTPYTAEVIATYGNGLGLGDVTLPNQVVVEHTTYGNGLGLGDVTLPNQVVVEHTTTGLNDYVLVDGADPAALHAALAHHPEVDVTDRNSFAATQGSGQTGQSSVNLLLDVGHWQQSSTSGPAVSATPPATWPSPGRC